MAYAYAMNCCGVQSQGGNGNGGNEANFVQHEVDNFTGAAGSVHVIPQANLPVSNKANLIITINAITYLKDNEYDILSANQVRINFDLTNKNLVFRWIPE